MTGSQASKMHDLTGEVTEGQCGWNRVGSGWMMEGGVGH